MKVMKSKMLLEKRLEKTRKKFVAVEKPPFPNNMLLEITNSCNLKCTFCARKKMKSKPSFIDKKLAFSMLNQAYELGVRDVGIYGRGESMLSPILNDCITEAKRIGYEYVYLDTNGCCSRDKLQSVVDVGLDSIKFSINAGTKETYKMIHGRDCFEKVIDNIKFISHVRENSDVSFKLFASYVVTEENKNEKEKLKNILEDYVDEILFHNIVNPGGLMPENDPLVFDVPITELRCHDIFNRFHVTADGLLTTCCVDYGANFIMADLHNVSLKEAWHNDKDFVGCISKEKSRVGYVMIVYAVGQE